MNSTRTRPYSRPERAFIFSRAVVQVFDGLMVSYRPVTSRVP